MHIGAQLTFYVILSVLHQIFDLSDSHFFQLKCEDDNKHIL